MVLLDEVGCKNPMRLEFNSRVILHARRLDHSLIVAGKDNNGYLHVSVRGIVPRRAQFGRHGTEG